MCTLFGVAVSHSQIWHYFISYLLICEVDLFEVLEIMAQMWHYIIFFSHKPAKVTSDFILNNFKKVIGGATTQKNLKTSTKTLISSIWTRHQGPQGCQKMRYTVKKILEIFETKFYPMFT